MKVTSKDLLNEAYKLMCTDIRGLDQEEDSLNEDAGAWIVIGVYVGYLALIIAGSALCAHLTRKNAARQATAVDREEFTAAIEYLKNTWFDEFFCSDFETLESSTTCLFCCNHISTTSFL